MAPDRKVTVKSLVAPRVREARATDRLLAEMRRLGSMDAINKVNGEPASG